METEVDVARELELFEEYARLESLDAFLDYLARNYCGDVY